MILCCGEALVDMIPEETVSGAQGFVPHMGGAVYNTAVALGRLGAPVGLLSGVSQDLFGQQLRAGLAASHVDASRIISSPRPSTLAFVQLTDGHASYSFFDENSAGRALVPQDMPELGSEITTLFFGGISLACEPCALAYADLLRSQGQGRVVMIDPNIRPGFIADEPRYRARLELMFAQAQIVKLSDEDLQWLHPGGGTLAEKAGAVLAAGPEVVILTKGAEGALGFTRSGIALSVAAQPAEVVDTVGAGDAFNAGILAQLQARELLLRDRLAEMTAAQLEQALAHASRVAAATVARAGANPPWAGEV